MERKKTPRHRQKKAKIHQRLGQGSQEEWTARPNPIKPAGNCTTKKSMVLDIDEIVQPPTTSVAAAAVTTRSKRKSTPEGEGGGGRTQRQKRAATATTAPNPTTNNNNIDRSGTGPSGGGGGRSAEAGESGSGSGGGERTDPSIYRYSEENETVVLSRIANIKLDKPGVVEGLLLEAGRVQDQLRVGEVGLREALRVTFGHVARSLLDSAEGMPSRNVGYTYVIAGAAGIATRKADRKKFPRECTTGGKAGGAASAGVNPEGRGPTGPVGGGWKEDLMRPYRFRAGASVTVGDRNVTLPSMTLRCESKVSGHAKPVAFLIETTGGVYAEERQCSCRKTLRVSVTDKKTLESLGIGVHSSATSGRRRVKSKLQRP